MIRWVLLAVVAVAGCTDLPDFEVDQCGNGVIDRDEDCDGGAGCMQCRRVCESDAECATLPGQYLCGADHVCHAPSGVFAQTPSTSFPFVVGQGSVADLDGDRIGDVVGFSDITIDTRFGDLDANLTTRATQLLPYSDAQIALRRFDSTQGTTDILVPTPDGIASYTATASKSLVAYPFANDPGPRGVCATANLTGEPIASFAMGAGYIGFVVRNRTTGVASIAVLDLFSGSCKELPACGLVAPDPEQPGAPRVAVDHYDTPGLQLTSVIAVGAPISETEQRVCAVRFNENGFALTSLTPTPHAAATGPIALARATVTGACPALYTGRLQPSGLNYYAATGTAGACTLSATAVRVLDTGVNAVPTGRIPLQPPIAGMAPDALVVVKGRDFSTSTEIHQLLDQTTIVMYSSPRPLGEVHAADLDGDGTIEAVASALGGGPGGGEPDLDILYRAMGTFVPYRISTQSVPTHLELGDYDGNGLHDIAYTERVGSIERLMVAYGTRDRPLPAVEIAKFSNIVTLNLIDVPDSIDPMGGLLDDLLVVDEPDDLPLLTILHGNPQRSMLAYYDPRGPVGGGGRGFFAALAGDFDPTTPAIDVLALEQATDAATDFVQLWIATGQEGQQGLANRAASTVVPSIAPPIVVCPASAHLCSAAAEYLAWPIAGRDIVLALEGPGRARRRLVTIATNTNGDGTGVTTTPFDPGALVESLAIPFGMFGADVDGDGTRDLLVSLGGLGMSGPPVADRVVDCKVGLDGVVQSCASLVDEVEALQGWVCRGAERGILSARGRHDDLTALAEEDVVVLCTRDDVGQIFRIEHATGTMVAMPVVGGAIGYEILSAGDVNGDRLVDLIGVGFDPESQTPIVNIHLQCDARDVTCRRDNSATIFPGDQ